MLSLNSLFLGKSLGIGKLHWHNSKLSKSFTWLTVVKADSSVTVASDKMATCSFTIPKAADEYITPAFFLPKQHSPYWIPYNLYWDVSASAIGIQYYNVATTSISYQPSIFLGWTKHL